MNQNRPTEDLLDELLLLPNDERSSYLACLRNEDPKLGEKLRKLLAASENAGTFLDLDEDSSECKLPAKIGPYQIREKIGEGGMGVVYVAEQTQPVQRKVALKIIKPGMDTKEVIARFEAERQALGVHGTSKYRSGIGCGSHRKWPFLLRDGTRARNSDHGILRPS